MGNNVSPPSDRLVRLLEANAPARIPSFAPLYPARRPAVIMSESLQPARVVRVNSVAMKPSSPSWPRGILAGALLAVCLIIPVFMVMLFDSAVGSPAVSSVSNRFALFQRPVQLQAHGTFFAGKLAVSAVLAQRFALLPRTEQGQSPGDRRDLLDGEPAPEVAGSTVLRLRLENHSTEVLAVDIVRVVSTLGSFAAEPDRVILAPHQSTSIDSIVPDQKIPASSIPVAVALRHDGSVETRRLLLNEHVLAQARD